MQKKRSILFVCTGNTCRSPMAEGLFKQAAKDHPEWEIKSAGVAATDGCPASYETLYSLERHGINLTQHQSNLLDRDMMQQATHIFVMTASHMAILLANFPEYTDKIHLVTEYTDGRDIDDPIGYGQDAYDQVAESMKSAIRAIIETWEREDAAR